MKDNRRCLRFSLELPTQYKKIAASDDSFSEAVALDISATGICFVSEQKLFTGEQLVMKLKLSAQETVVIRTKVVWVKSAFGSGANEYRVGVKILEPIQLDEAKFVKFCARIMLDLFRS